MTVESVTYISDLDDTYPAGSGPPSEGDNHIRNIKTGLAGTFPNFAGAAVTATEAELNYVDITTLGTSQASKVVTADASGNINFDGTGAVDLTDITNPINIGLTSNPATGAHLALDEDQIQAKTDSTTAAAISLNPLGGNVSIGAQSGTGLTYLYGSGSLRFNTATGGVALLRSNGNTDAETRYLGFTHQDGTERAFAGHNGGAHFYVRNEIHGGLVYIQSENAAGTVTTLAVGDPDGVFAAYNAGTQRLRAGASGVVNLRSDGSTDAENRYLSLDFQDGSVRGLAGFVGSGTLRLNSYVHGGLVGLYGENTAGTATNLVIGDPDDDVKLYDEGVEVARTLPAASGGFQINNTSTGAGFERALTTGDFTNATHTTPTLTSPTINTAVSGTAVLDEDDMASDSATQLATQQSIKAYADSLHYSLQGFRAYLSASEAGLTNTTYDFSSTNFTNLTEDFDTDSLFTASNGQFKPTVAGYYQVGFYATGLNIASGSTITAAILFNGASTVRREVFASTGTVYLTSAKVSSPIHFNGSTDYIIYQVTSTDASWSLIGADYGTEAFAYLLRAD